MPQLANCPTSKDLQSFSLGQLAAPQAEQLEQHLIACGPCLAALEMLSSSDLLTQAVRAQAATPAPPENETVNQLIEQFRNQPPRDVERTTAPSDASPSEERTQVPTGAAAQPAVSSEEATQAPTTGDAPPATVPNGYDFLAPPQAADEIGRLGRYRILEVLGAGGMGMVFRAESLDLERPVALKIMLPSMAATASARERFLREARTAASIEHDNVITIYQVGEDRGVPFIAMQLLKGESLDDRLRREGTLPIAEVLRIARETAAGLAAAQERGLIHRDIKPANLWLEGERGRVKILDFGLARAARDSVHLTQSGLIIGTPAYMAPEQSRATGVDHRADLFSLGCVLYRCCTGRLPFNGTDTISILAALALDDPPPPRELNDKVPPGLSKLIMLLLAKDPAGRPPSAAAVVKTITTWEAGGRTATLKGIAKAPPAVPARAAKATEFMEVLPADPAPRKGKMPARPHQSASAPRRRWPIAVAAVVLLAILGPLGYWGAVTIVRLANGHGQLVIETDDPDVEVRVKHNGEQVTIVDAKTNKEITLRAGTYELELAGGKDGLTLSTNQFTLSRGGREVVKVRLDVQEVRMLEGGHGRVWGVAFSPDGRWVASCGNDGTARLWDVASGRELHCFRGHTDAVRSVSFTPDGRHLLSASWDRTMRLWDVDTASEIRCFKGHPGGINSAALSPDGRRVLSGGAVGVRGALLVWDVETAKVLQQFEDVSGQVFHAAWSPDGKTVLSAMHNGLRLWDAASGKMIRSFPGHSHWVLSVAFSSDGRQALSGSADNTMRLWDVSTGRQLACFAAAPPGTPGGKAGVHGVALSRGGAWALSAGSDDGILRLWDVAGAKEGRRLEVPGVGFTCAAFSPKGTLAISGATDGFLRLWRLPELARDKARPANPSPDEKLQALAPDEVRRFVAGHGGKEKPGQWDDAHGVALAPDGRLFSGGQDGILRQWDFATGEERKQWRLGKTVTHVGLMPDHQHVLCGVIREGWMGFVLFDPQTGQEVRRFAGRETWPTDEVVSPDGRQFIGSGNGSALAVYDIATGARRRTIGTPLWVTRMTASTDFRWALSCSQWKTTAWLWDIASGKPGPQLVGHTDGIVALALSPNGRRALTGGKDKTVRLWDVETSKELKRFEGHTDTVSSVALSPDGRRVLSGGADHTLRLWNVETGKEIHCYRGHTGKITTVQLLPDGSHAISASVDQSVRLWRLPTD